LGRKKQKASYRKLTSYRLLAKEGRSEHEERAACFSYPSRLHSLIEFVASVCFGDARMQIQDMFGGGIYEDVE
jgi:hypothetical protein